jgi:CHAT domain-containing protein
MRLIARLFMFILGLVFVLSLNIFPLAGLKAAEPDVSLDRQASTYYWQGRIQFAISIWENLLKTSSPPDAAAIHSYLGVAYRQIGQLGTSIRHFKEAIAFSRQHEDKISRTRLIEALIEQARTYNELGQWDRAQPLLDEAISLTKDKEMLALRMLAYRAQGTAFWLEGNFDEAIGAYQYSRDLASVLGRTEDLVAVLNDLTNALQSRRQKYLGEATDVKAEGEEAQSKRLQVLASQDRQAALWSATRAVEIGRQAQSLSTVRAMVNLTRLSETVDYRSEAATILDQFPPSRSKAELLMELALEDGNAAIALLEKAIATADTIGARRTQSFALVQLGQVYEKTQKYDLALETSQQAQWTAQEVVANDSLYRAQWLSGRIYRATNRSAPAIAAYQSAIATLQKFREEIASASPDWQFDTKRSVEPVYRELLALLLEKQPHSPQTLASSINTAQQLQFAQLQSFFGDACLELKQASIDSSSRRATNNAAVIHYITLEESTSAIVEFPDRAIRAYPVKISATDLERDLKNWRMQLQSERIPLGYRNLSERLYDLLIRPIEADLAKTKTEELIFINDGLLRNVPLAALHDRTQFLIEKYPISISLGLDLKFPPSSPSSSGGSIFGLTEAIEGFPALPSVAAETLATSEIVGGERFLDSEFTLLNLEAEMAKNRAIVHLATHGEFGGTIERTFLQAADRQISLKELERVFGQRTESIELLTLSACDTAAGNDRAILGLAGVALRAGVKNVLASLWAVNDKTTTELITAFYRYLKQGMSKPQALQKAQLEQLSQSHVSRWTTFLLVNS